MKTWAVVKFIKDKTIEAVPTNWIIDGECYWPPPTYTKEQLNSALKNNLEPEDFWESYAVHHYENNIFGMYSQYFVFVFRIIWNSTDEGCEG